jgi:DNA polymerase
MRLGLDLETYFSSTYTLKKGKYQHTTAEYIRSPEFLIHGGSVKVDRKPTRWMRRDALLKFLQNDVNWTDTDLIAHHAQFEGLILKEHVGVEPRSFICTLSMSRAINQTSCRHDLYSVARHLNISYTNLEAALDATKGLRELTPELEQPLSVYCDQDVDIADTIAEKLLPFFIPAELWLMNFTIKLFTNPVLLTDRPRAIKAMEAELAEKAALIDKTGYTRKDFTSNPKFAKILENAGITVPMKISPTTGEQTYAFAKGDSAFLDLRDSPDERTRDLMAARIHAKSNQNENKTQRLLRITEDNKPWPVYLNHYGAHTGRPSGGDKVNPLALKRGSELRKSIIAPPGYRLVVSDSAQIEARVNPWQADELGLLEAFRADRDVYSEFASEIIYHRPINRKRIEIINGIETHPDELEGFVGKVCILGLGFGMGPPKLKATLAAGALSGPRVFIELDTSTGIVYGYRGKYEAITASWKTINNLLWAMTSPKMKPYTYKGMTFSHERIRLPNGMDLYYPDLGGYDGDLYYTVQEGGRTKIYGGLGVENIVQALARIIVTDQLQIIDQRWRAVMFTYDEVVALAPEDEADKCFKFMLDTMATPPAWAPDLPLKAEGGHEVFYNK